MLMIKIINMIAYIVKGAEINDILFKNIMEIPPKKQVRITAPSSDTAKYGVSPNCILTVILGLFAIMLAWTSHHYFNSIKTFLHLENAKFNKFNNQIKSLSQFAFLFSIYLLGITIMIFIFYNLINLAYDNPLLVTLRRVISNSLEQFIMFVGLYAYVVTQSGSNDKKEQLILIGNLFLIGRYLYLGGALMQFLTGMSFKQAGNVLNTIVMLILVRQILDQWFDISG